MDSLDKHVKQISFRQCITFREHGQLKGWQPHFQPTDAKVCQSLNPVNLNHGSLVCSSHKSQLRAQSIQYPVTQTLDTITVLYVTNLGDHNSVTTPFASLHETRFFSAAATKGWAWYKHNAELVEHTAALRDLKLLVGSGGLDFTKGMDSLDKHVKQISFRQCITFREHRQLKGWQPRFQPTDAKSSILSISTIVHWISLVCSSHVSQLRAQSIPCNPNLGHNDCIVRNTSWRPQLRDHTLCFSAWDSLFPVAATKGWAWCNHNAGLMERAAALRSFKLLVGSGCLEFQNGMAGMDPETNMSSHGANICGWNAHSPVSNPRRLKALSAVVTEEHNQYIVTLFGHHNSVTKPSASLHEAGFLQLQRIWEWCKNVELVERAAALRGSGCSEFQEGMAGMDSLHKHVEQISFRQCFTFCKHRQLKRWRPHFQPKEAKSFVCSSHREAISILQQFLETTTPWPNPLLLCMRRIFFLQLQRRDGRDTSIMQNWWSILRLSGTSSFW